MKSLLLYCFCPVTWEELDMTLKYSAEMKKGKTVLYFISDMIQSTQHVRGPGEELHTTALLVLHLRRDGRPVRHQPVRSINR